VAAGLGAGVSGVAVGDGLAELDAGRADGADDDALDGAVAGLSATSLASARFTASSVSCWAELPPMPWPSSETASRLPAVAVAAPRSQAARPKRMRLCTLHLPSGIAKGE
jgi:hypothetical protein